MQLAVYAGVFVLLIHIVLTSEFTIWRALLVAAGCYAVWQHWGERAEFEAKMAAARGEGGIETEGESGPKDSLVLWLREPLYLDTGIVSRLAGGALEVPFGEGEDCGNFVVGEPPLFMLKVGDGAMIVHHFERNYFDDPDVAEELGELRCAEAIRQHRAWLAVDLMRWEDGDDERDRYAIIGRLLAGFVSEGADVLAVFHPASGRIAPWSAEMGETLAGGDALSVFAKPAYVPVIRVDSDSKEMAEAVAEARRRWPEFVAAFVGAENRDSFCVKAPVTEAGNTEFIWLNVKAIADGQIHGMLANDPVALGELKLGSFVTVPESEINDWVCPDPANPDRPLGLFTVAAARSTERR